MSDWSPEVSVDFLEKLARSLNTAFGENVAAHVSGEELSIHFGNKKVWLNTQGNISGMASFGRSQLDN